jgi:hypothetical protein
MTRRGCNEMKDQTPSWTLQPLVLAIDNGISHQLIFFFSDVRCIVLIDPNVIREYQ